MQKIYFKRINRKKYFWSILLNTIICSFISNSLNSIWGIEYYDYAWITHAILCVYFIIFSYFTIRRCHDLGKSGWYALLAYIPFVPLYFIFAKGKRENNVYD